MGGIISCSSGHEGGGWGAVKSIVGIPELWCDTPTHGGSTGMYDHFPDLYSGTDDMFSIISAGSRGCYIYMGAEILEPQPLKN